MDETVAELGGLDALVNNAGVTVAKPALELTAADFDSIFSIDVRAAFLLAQHAARRMGDGGAIVNVTSVHEHVPRAGFALYASAKAALGMLTRSLALELAPSIRVNAVAPERSRPSATRRPTRSPARSRSAVPASPRRWPRSWRSCSPTTRVT